MDLYPTDINRMSWVFRNTTSTYKFYWMLALLDAVNAGHRKITFNEMVARMLSKAWQPIKNGYFCFGKCDVTFRHIDELIKRSPLHMDSYEDTIRCYIMNNPNMKKVKEIVKEMTRYVPYRVLYPWIGTCNNSEAKSRTMNPAVRPLYFFVDDGIEINPLWFNYLVEHNYILHGFTYHHLTLFLEHRNPGFVLPMEESIRNTADGTSLPYSYLLQQDLQNSMVAERPIRVGRINLHYASFNSNINTDALSVFGISVHEGDTINGGVYIKEVDKYSNK